MKIKKFNEILGEMSWDEMLDAVNDANAKHTYSKKLVMFKPINIKLLKPIRKEEAGHIIQMIMTPDGNISIGYYNDRGSGKNLISYINPQKFQEDIDFIFIN